MKNTRLLALSLAAAAFTAPAAVSDAGSMFQGFFWDTPGGWYNIMSQNSNAIRYQNGGYGADRIWFPPSSKGQGGGFSMGYDPADYYDMGNYNQHGWTATRFGTKAELTAATASYRNKGVTTMADIIINHRSGGSSEYNPNVGYNTYTNFQYQQSGMALWHYNEFHPSSYWGSDEGAFGGYADVCHRNPYVWNDLTAWGNWMKGNSNAGFNGGWRFDFVKGFGPWMAKDFRQYTGWMYGVGELWDADVNYLDWWAGSADSSAFDFAAYYTLAGICNNTGGGGYLPDLVNQSKSFSAKNKWRAVGFAENHHTHDITNHKHHAYAYLYTYQGYPCTFWKDFFDYNLDDMGGQWGNGIKQLTWVREKLGQGGPDVQNMKTDDGNLLIFGDSSGWGGNPGYIAVINDDSYNWRGAWVNTSNGQLRNKSLKAYAWYSTNSGQNYQPGNQWCQSNGWVQVWAPPRGYAVYAPDGY